MMHGEKDSVRIRNREYIGDINSSTSFVNRQYVCNPGLPATFPWLSSVAQNFEQYKFRGLMFEFVSTSADALNSTNTALGQLIMTAEYNVSAPPYANLQQALNAMWSVSTKPSCSAMAPIECSGAQNPLDVLFVRTGAVPPGQDQRFYDLANMQVMTNGSQAVANVGQLWVTYDVELSKPQTIAPYGDDLQTAFYQMTLDTTTGTPSIISRVFDSFPNFIGIANGPGDTLRITFPQGTQGDFQVSLFGSGASTSISGPPNIGSFAGGCALRTGFPLATAAVVQSPLTGTVTTLQATFTVNIPGNSTTGNAPAFSLDWSGITWPTPAACSVALFVTQVNL